MGKEKIERGDIYTADLPHIDRPKESIQEGKRPVVIISSSRYIEHSPNVYVAPITSRIKKPDMRTHVVLAPRKGLPKWSMVLGEQHAPIAKERILDYRCTLDEATMKKVTRAVIQSIKG